MLDPNPTALLLLVIGHVAAASLAAYAVYLFCQYIIRPFIKRRPKAEQKPEEGRFLEAALDGDVKDRPSSPKYSWGELQRDLHDGSMSFEEIYEKYGGVFPEKPEPPRTLSEEEQSTEALQGADGGLPGVTGALGMPNGGAPEKEPLRELNLKKLLGASPGKWKEIEPELPIWVKCCACKETHEYGYPRVCGMCGGKGYLIGREA